MTKARQLLKQSPRPAPSALALLNALPDMVIGFDADAQIGFSNHAAQAFFRLGEKQLAERGIKGLLGAENAAFESVERAIRKNQTVTLHDVAIGGKPVGSIVISTVDPDAWYLMTVRLQPAQLASEWNEKTRYSLQSTEKVAQMMAHEIKNPLAGIRGAAQLLGKSNLGSEDRELACLIERETVRIQGLVDKFNIFHEVPQSRYTAVNLHEVLNHVLGVMRAAYGDAIEMVEDFDPSLPDIRGHFDHLVQAKLNLFKNAAEAFGGKKGRISVRTYYDNAAGYHPERPEKLPLCVEIEDNGTGIAAEEISRIFQPYFTTKPNGQGLGLPIVSKIVDDHGGTIHVSSAPGRTVFRINFPIHTSIKKKQP